MIKKSENQEILGIISGMTGLSVEKSEQLFLDIWLITHGIASMVAANDVYFTEEQVMKILMDSFLGITHQLSL